MSTIFTVLLCACVITVLLTNVHRVPYTLGLVYIGMSAGLERGGGLRTEVNPRRLGSIC